MNDSFKYRQQLRQERLLSRQRAARRRRIHAVTYMVSFVLLVFTVVFANAIIAMAGQGCEKEYQKLYTSVVIEQGQTVWDIAEECAIPGVVSVPEMVEEIAYINNLDEACTIITGSMIMVPYYREI